MNTQKSICLIICLLTSLQALATGLSETNQGIYVAIGGARSTNEPIRFDERLAYMPFCNTGGVDLAVATPAYGTRIKMIGPDGKEVAKTALGRSFGSKFDQWHTFNDIRPLPGGIYASGSYEGLLGPLLPAPNELFVMEHPGVYNLEVQLQMFRVGAHPDTNAATRNPIQFSPVKIKVEKPAPPGAK